MANQSDGSNDGGSVNQNPSEQEMLERQKAFFESFKGRGLYDVEMVNGELRYTPIKPIVKIKLDGYRHDVMFPELMEALNEKTNNG